MSYLFDGSAENMMANALAALARAAENGPARKAHFCNALVALVGVYERSARAGAPAPERLATFRRDCAAALAGCTDLLSWYASDACTLAEGANDDEWPELCMRRSALQVLLDDQPEAAAAIDRDDLAELDTEMRRVGDDQGPLPADIVVPGLPASHWWWRYPEEQPLALAGGIRVLDPDLAYATLRDRLQAAGWRCIDASRQPIVAGEPEFALFEAGDGARLAYSFNPVCRLRLLEGPAVPDPAGGDLLPPVDPALVLDWMRSADERTLLRGILAARQMPSATLLERLKLLRSHAHPTLAKAAAEAADVVRAALAVRWTPSPC